MTDREFRLLVADCYEEALTATPERGREILLWFHHDIPVPFPWWSIHAGAGLQFASQGLSYPHLSPQKLRDFEIFEAENRRSAEREFRRLWNPFPKHDDRHREHRKRFDQMVESALEFAQYSELHDDQIPPLLASALRTALNADHDYRLSEGEERILRQLVSRARTVKCLPLGQRAVGSLNELEKILAYWDSKSTVAKACEE